MLGVNAQTGKALDGIAHLRQSITDILTTPIGTRVMRRQYGSRLFELLDAPMNRQTFVLLYAATAEAITRWEPRFKVERVTTDSATPGRISLTVTGIYKPEGKAVTIDGIIIK